WIRGERRRSVRGTAWSREPRRSPVRRPPRTRAASSRTSVVVDAPPAPVPDVAAAPVTDRRQSERQVERRPTEEERQEHVTRREPLPDADRLTERRRGHDDEEPQPRAPLPVHHALFLSRNEASLAHSPHWASSSRETRFAR